jgi:hypothetical protein
MSFRSFIRKIAGRAGKATRSNKGAKSHINTKRNKRAGNKAIRVCEYAEADAQGIYDRMFYEDHHLDIPDEVKEKYNGKV